MAGPSVADFRQSSPVVTRFAGNPILGVNSAPYAPGLVYNGSAIRYQGRYVMLVRVDHADVPHEKLENVSTVALATSVDGTHWEIAKKPAIDWKDDEIQSPTDPRLMLVDGRPFVTVAVQTWHGMQTFVLTTEDFERFDLIYKMVPDDRDVVLFPEKLGDRYLMIHRPFPTFGHNKHPVFDMWISQSPDLLYWGRPEVLIDVDRVPYANQRIGAGTPPLKTEKGWLMLFHAVITDPNGGKNGWEEKWTDHYYAGVLLLDLEDPRKVVGLSPEPLLVPQAYYETSGGYRNDIVFPCGWILEDTGEVKIYYGAADSVQCLATAHIGDLLGLCKPVGEAMRKKEYLQASERR